MSCCSSLGTEACSFILTERRQKLTELLARGSAKDKMARLEETVLLY